MGGHQDGAAGMRRQEGRRAEAACPGDGLRPRLGARRSASEVGTSGSAGSPSRVVVASGSSGDSHGSVYGYVTKRATLVRVVFNDGRKPLEITPVRAGPRFPVDFYIVYFPQQGSSGGWRVAQVLALDRDGRVIASCRASDTCGES